jgi:stage V sporulation protein B
MFPHVISNLIEDIVRLILIGIMVPIFMLKGLEAAICFIILSNIASELTSILILFIFLPKNFKINISDLKININYLKDIFKISIPNTIARLIGNIGYFLEPIILTYVLIKVGYSKSFIVDEYGIISGYVMPILLLPSFFTMAISQALIPVISKLYAQKNIKAVKKKIFQAIYFSLLVGIPSTLIFLFIPEIPLKLIYNTNLGTNYIKFLAPICLLQYIQSPLSSTLNATLKSNDALKSTLIGMIVRTSSLFILSFLKIGLWSLVYSVALGIITTTFYEMYKVKSIIKDS